MTNREFLTAVASTETLATELREHAANEIAKMDAANAKRKEKAAAGNTKKAQENAPIVAAIREALTSEPQTAVQIAAIVGCTHNKVTPLVKGLVAEGVATMAKAKIPGKGEMNVYALAE